LFYGLAGLLAGFAIQLTCKEKGKSKRAKWLNCQWLNGCNGQWSLVNRKKEKGKNGLMVKWLIVND